MPQAKLISPITRQEIRKVRVAAYCRVSSNSADQQNSYANQIRVYTSLIQRKKEWELVEIFADEGLSGMNAQNRTEFQRMIKMCEQHQIDLIVTKSVSRFARNAKESLEYVRKLKLLGVGVQFEKEGIYTLALGDEMLLNTFSAIAQEESKAISQNQRLSIVKIRYIPYGYTMRNGRTVIAQDEAAVIREIFSAYINGASLQSIAELLTERKIPYSERTDVWDKARIARIIGNAKYIGDGEYDPIIEEEQYEEAAAVKTARQRNTFEKNLEGIDLLRDLVRCAECGAPMRRRVSSKHRIRESWDCTDPDCGQRIRISDTHLLEKVTILMNRIIANSYLLIPRPKKRKELSAEAQQINREIDAELERDDPSDALIIVKTIEMAERLYAESDAHLQIAASIARKRVTAKPRSR